MDILNVTIVGDFFIPTIAGMGWEENEIWWDGIQLYLLWGLSDDDEMNKNQMII